VIHVVFSRECFLAIALVDSFSNVGVAQMKHCSIEILEKLTDQAGEGERRRGG
jgi:hypothetical protein